MSLELFSNKATTSLSLAVSSTTATAITVVAGTGFPAAATGSSQFRISIDNELLLVTNVVGTTWTVVRGIEGTVAATHAAAATVSYALTRNALSRLQQMSGVSIPADWGKNWYTAVANSTSTVARLGMVGDSVGQGYWASNLRATSYFELLRANATARCGNGGSGYDGMQFSDTFGTGAPVGAYNAYKALGNWWAQTGTWSTPSNWSYGPSAGMLVGGASGSTITRSVVGSSVEVVYLDNTGPFTVKIDAAAPVTVTPGTSFAVSSFTTSGLSSGSHTVVVTATSGVGPYLMGFSGSNSSGVRADNYSMAGAESAVWSRLNGDPLLSCEYAAGWRRPVDLLIVEMTGANDVYHAVQSVGSVVITAASSTITGNFSFSMVGRLVTAAGLPPGTSIVSVSPGISATLSAAATASSVSSVTVTNNKVVENWASSMQSYLQGVLDGGAGTGPFGRTDVLFLIPFVSAASDSRYIYAQLRSQIWSMANDYGAAVVDLGATYRQSWNQWNYEGKAGNSSNPAVSGGDAAHPSDAGHAYISNLLSSILFPS